MHLYLLTRGMKQYVDEFITELQGKYLPFHVEKDGTANLKKGEYQVQVQVRPIQLWEIIYPEGSNDVMLNTILGEASKKIPTQHNKHKKFIWAIKKALGAEDIPDFKTDRALPICRAHTEFVGIGIKKDRYEDGTEML